jgi:serine protease AprX
MHKNAVFIHAIVALSLVIGLVGSTSFPASAGNQQLNADPRLLELAAAHPDDVFHVIVQRAAKNKDLKSDDPAVTIESDGGTVDRSKKMGFIASFAAQLTGREVGKLARHPGVRWISFDSPAFLAGSFGSNTYRDEFSYAYWYSGSNGTTSWNTSPWAELGESDGARYGLARLVSSSDCASGNCLRIGGDGVSIAALGVSRKARLTSATTATLSFSRNLQITMPTDGKVYLQVSPDGAAWTTLDTFLFAASDNAPVAGSYDISPYISSTTQVRFIGDGVASGYLYIDNVQIDYSNLANSYIRTTQTDRVWAGNSSPGASVTVAVVDSGMTDHPDLYTGWTSRVIASVDFSENRNPAEPVGYDDYGHGAHVAGIIAGAGQASQGARVGNAPFVNLVNVKVTGADGSGCISDVITGLQWIYNNKDAYNIKVVNISMNSAVPESYNASPLDAAVEILWFNGITVVVAAGNNGTGNGPVPLLPPANDPFVITVGSLDDMGTPAISDDAVAATSAYGTTEDGFAKPDLVAPGRNIISLLASTSSNAYINHPANRVDSNYFRMSGTSMAAPMVTGAAALLLQQNPSLTPDQIKYRLMATARSNWPGYDPARVGAGTLNTYAAANGKSAQSANIGVLPSTMLTTGSNPVAWSSVGWNSVGWNSVGWNSVGWNSVGWNSVGWNSVGWNSVGWNSSDWEP